MSDTIREPLFTGRCAVRALWFDLDLIGEASARQRILAHWRAGARLYRAGGGYLLEWPQAVWLHVGQLDALALCEVGHVLSSAPLNPAELAGLEHASYWLVRGAQAWSAAPQAPVDPSSWLKLEHVAMREPLRFPVPRPVAGEADEGAPVALRDILGTSVPPASAERARFLQRAAQVGQTAAGGGTAAGALAAVAATAALGIVGLLARWAGAGRSNRGTPEATGSASPVSTAAPVLSPMAKALADLRDRLAVLSGASKLMGWRQGQFLQKTLDMFSRGDLMEALRHAIPLGAFNGDTDWTAMGTPGRRDGLTIGGVRGGGSIGVDARVQQHLRDTYRRAFERLDREGRVDEAVFVLAELLGCGAEAVIYLEKHARYKQAAQLAETLQLAPEIALRMWLLAGDPARAMRIARLHTAYDAAVRLLESKQSEHAAWLRLAWANYLAERGDLVQAIDVIWPLSEHHGLARAWFGLAERAGGTLGMRLLARKLALMPESLAEMASAVEAVLGAQGEEGRLQRERLARELTLCRSGVAVQRVAAALVRRLVADSAQGQSGVMFHELDKLVKWSGDAVLAADLPPLRMAGRPPVVPLTARSAALTVALDERGLLPIHDARWLPDGGYLLALGESGVVRINRAGKQSARYPVPAEHLVLADNGQRALALMGRDASVRISRIDLITGKVSDWLSLHLDWWAQRYDGVIWNAVQEGRLVALDTAAAQRSVSWQVSDLPGRISAFIDRGAEMTMLLDAGKGIEQWTYALPGRQLRGRDSYPSVRGAGKLLLPGSGAVPPFLLEYQRDGDNSVLLAGHYGVTRPLRLELGVGEQLQKVLLDGELLLALVQNGILARVIVVNLKNGTTLATAQLSEPERPGMVVQESHLLLFDRAGRMVDIDLQTGNVVTRTLS